jgi:hypothetical protein
MRSIIVCTTVILAIAGLIHTQNTRLLSNFDLSAYLDLGTDINDATEARDFISQLCATPGPMNSVFGAINVETNETMSGEDYMRGPGALAERQYEYSAYPWSTFEGRCQNILNTSHVTDRAVIYGPAVNNNLWRNRTMTLSIDTVTPKVVATTTKNEWMPYMTDAMWVSHFFKYSPQRPDALVNSMVWSSTDVTEEFTQDVEVPGCTQARLTAATVARTVTAFSGFTLEAYYWSYLKTEWVWWKWQTKRVGFKSDTWMAIKKDDKGKVVWDSRGFRTLYSSELWIKAETLTRLLPPIQVGQPYPVGYLTMQVQTTPLPPEECYFG